MGEPLDFPSDQVGMPIAKLPKVGQNHLVAPISGEPLLKTRSIMSELWSQI